MAKPKKQSHPSFLIWGGFLGAAYLLWPKTKPVATSGVSTRGIGSLTSLRTSLPIEEVVGTIRRVAKDLGNSINKAASMTGVPAWLINIISAHEIRFKPYSTVNPAVHATGPCQLTPPTLFDTYYLAQTWQLVTPALTDFLKAKMGPDYAKFIKLAAQRSSNTAMANKYLADTEVNLAIGGLLLSVLSHLFNDGQMVNQARLVLGYNRGPGWSVVQTAKALNMNQTSLIKAVSQPGWKLPPKLAVTTADTLIPSAPGAEAKSYVRDMLGQGGYFDQSHVGGL